MRPGHPARRWLSSRASSAYAGRVQRWLIAAVIAAGLVLTLVLPLSLAGDPRTAASVTFHYVQSSENCPAALSNAGGSLSAKQPSQVVSLIGKTRHTRSRQELDRLVLEIRCYANHDGAHVFGISSGAAEVIPAGPGKTQIILTQRPH
jgi:hypothetical protein